MNSLSERAQFEEFRGGDLERCASGEYRNWSVENDWMLWQAAYSAGRKEAYRKEANAVQKEISDAR